MNDKYIYVGIGMTESMDGMGPYTWENYPEQVDINTVLMRDWREDYEADCITYFRVERCVLETTEDE